VRAIADRARIEAFLQAFGRAVRGPGRLYLTGGATAVLEGWRPTTIDVDLKLDPEPDGAFEAIARLKDELDVNIELASPADFIPELPGWKDRCRHVGTFGSVEVLHYDPSAQALAKLERGHARDLADVDAMVRLGLVDRGKLAELFEAIRPVLIRHPAIDEETFAEKVRAYVERSP
jgi:hypothetical protein